MHAAAQQRNDFFFVFQYLAASLRRRVKYLSTTLKPFS
jgi:hypothetical protein